MKKVIIAFTIFIALAANSQTISITQLDAYIENGRKLFNVPGIAVGIVKNDTILLAKGYGLRKIGANDSVNENTIFPIASLSKGFTAAAIGILVDQGKLKWEDKVIDYLPYFKLYDPYVTQNFTIQDLLSHRSGLKTFSGDLVWYCTNYSREEVIRRAQFLKPEYGFRTHYGYSNIMFIAASEIIKAVSDTTWDDFVKYHFFQPLKMKNTFTTLAELERAANKAFPHTEVDGKMQSLFFQNWNNMAGAGAINSSVADLIKWIQLLLNKGVFNEKVFFSESVCREMWSPKIWQDVSKNQEKRFPSMHFSAYGLGWGLSDYLGRKIISHSGGYDGVVTYLTLVPEEKLGIVVLTNANSSLYYALYNKILENYLNAKDRDWVKNIYDAIKKNEKIELDEKNKFENERILNTKPTLDLSKYEGLYSCELYGDAKIYLKDGKLNLEMLPTPFFKAVLEHRHYDTFTIKFEKFPALPKGTINFTIDAQPKVIKMLINIENPDFDFTELDFIKKK